MTQQQVRCTLRVSENKIDEFISYMVDRGIIDDSIEEYDKEEFLSKLFEALEMDASLERSWVISWPVDVRDIKLPSQVEK